MENPPDDIPLDFDNRLSKVKPSQYRIWYDGQFVLVKKGDSTTKPLTPELVNVNTSVYGAIKKSYFKPPVVDFTSTNVKVERFDRYVLGIWRHGSDLPNDNPDIDYREDIGLHAIHADVDVIFKADTFTGSYRGKVEFKYYAGDTWESEKLHFHNYALQELYGDFFLVCNPLPYHTEQGISFDTGKFVQEVNLPITAIVERATIKSGNSYMPLLLQNTEYFPVNLDGFSIDIVGGE